MDNEKLISPYISAQFPAHYRENYPQLVEFVKMYYAWLEQKDQVIGHARRLVEYRDIDEIPEDYLIYFKSKYLPYIKFITNTDKRTLVKNVQDLYRSKGTERGINLFFRLVYGVPAEVYYPATDLFRLSDNTWIKRKYLELGHSELSRHFVGKKVIGARSGATAFAEKYVEKKVGNTYVNLLFISNIEGNFKFNEEIFYDGLELDGRSRPKIIGSLTDLTVTTASQGFKKGDIVSVYSNKGHGASARVSDVYETTGLVDFTLEDGGWGYSNDAVVYVSEKILTVKNVVVDYVANNPDEAPYVASPYFTLEKIYQPLANLNYRFDTSEQYVLVTKPSSDWYSVGSTLYQANSTANVAVGTVISNSSVNATAQNLVVSVAKSNSQQVDFLITIGGIGNIVVGSNSSINSTVLDANVSTNVFTINVGTILTSYNSTGGVISTVQVVNNQIYNSTIGTANLYIEVVSGNAELNTYFWAPSNTYSINSALYIDRSATGNVVGFSNTLTMFISNATSSFSEGQYLTQRRVYSGGYDISASGRIRAIGGAGNNFTVELDRATGVFRRTVNVHMQYANGVESGSTAYLNSYDGYIGVANITNDFSTIGNNRVYTLGWTYDGNSDLIILGSNSTANLVMLSEGKNATFQISNTFAYAESYSIYTELVGSNNQSNVPYMSLTLANTTAFSNSLTLVFTGNSTVNTNALEVVGGTADINLSTDWWIGGYGLTDFTQILSKNSTHITVSQNTWADSSGSYRLSPNTGLAWEFPKDTNGTINDVIDDLLTSFNGYVGEITRIQAENPGEDYNMAPMILIKDPYTAGFSAKDYIITYAPDKSGFMVGERVSEIAGAVGLIKSTTSINSTAGILYVRRQSLPLGNSTLSTSFTVGSVITGDSSGANGTIVGVDEDDSQLASGLNAIVSSNVIIGRGAVKTLEVQSSGYGFENNENAIFLSQDGLRAGTAKVSIRQQGTTSGVYGDESSFLSDGKYLHDGDYYQEFSYDIKTSLPRESYEDNYDSTMHLVGTKMFSTFVYSSESSLRLDIDLPESANLIANTA